MQQQERKAFDKAEISEELCWGIVPNNEWEIFVRCYKDGETQAVVEVFVNLNALDIPDDPYDSMGGAGCVIEVPQDASPAVYQAAFEAAIHEKRLIQTAIKEASDYLVAEAMRLSGGLLH